MADVKTIITLTLDLCILILYTIYYSCESVFRRFVKPRKKSLVGEVALITGAGHGLGREFALQLGQLGVKVICWDINAKTCHDTANQVREAGGDAESFECDVSNRQQVADTAKLMRYYCIVRPCCFSVSLSTWVFPFAMWLFVPFDTLLR